MEFYLNCVFANLFCTNKCFQQGGHCTGNQGNQGRVREFEKGLNSRGKVKEFEKKIGKSGENQGILAGCLV